MKDLAPALYAKLSGATSVTSLLADATAVYHEEAPQGAQYPYILFNLQGGVANYTLGARSWRNRVVQIKALTRSPKDAPDTTVADNIDAAVDALLTDGTISVSGAQLLVLRRVADIHYGENTDAGLVTHAGGLYRIGTA